MPLPWGARGAAGVSEAVFNPFETVDDLKEWVSLDVNALNKLFVVCDGRVLRDGYAPIYLCGVVDVSGGT